MYGNALIDAIFFAMCMFRFIISFYIHLWHVFCHPNCSDLLVCVQTEPIGLLSSSIRKKLEFYLDLISIHV